MLGSKNETKIIKKKGDRLILIFRTNLTHHDREKTITERGSLLRKSVEIVAGPRSREIIGRSDLLASNNPTDIRLPDLALSFKAFLLYKSLPYYVE